MATQVITVEFDDGRKIDVEAKPRDLAWAERAGVDFTQSGPVVALYAGAFAALQRVKRGGEDIDLPATLDEFMDAADCSVEAPEAEDAGEGGGQVPTPGEPQN